VGDLMDDLEELLEVGMEAVERKLIALRDSRQSQPLRGSGLVVKEPNGESSSIIRLGIDDALRIALLAIAGSGAR